MKPQIKMMGTDDKELFSEIFRPATSDKDAGDLNQISQTVIGCAFKVGNTLGCGFLEKVYENALAIEIRKSGLTVIQQKELPVHYDDTVVGVYQADLVVEGGLLVELKAVRELSSVHRAQCINYLRATGSKLCLLLNFGNTRVEVKRIIL